MLVKTRAPVLSNLLRTVVATGIDYDDFAQAANRLQTAWQIVRFVPRENDDGE